MHLAHPSQTFASAPALVHVHGVYAYVPVFLHVSNMGFYFINFIYFILFISFLFVQLFPFSFAYWVPVRIAFG